MKSNLVNLSTYGSKISLQQRLSEAPTEWFYRMVYLSTLLSVHSTTIVSYYDEFGSNISLSSEVQQYVLQAECQDEPMTSVSISVPFQATYILDDSRTVLPWVQSTRYPSLSYHGNIGR